MVLRLPYGMTVAEYSDLKMVFNAGYFEHGKTAQDKPPKKKNLSAIAAEAGKSKEAFSRTLSNARRKILSNVATQIFSSTNEMQKG